MKELIYLVRLIKKSFKGFFFQAHVNHFLIHYNLFQMNFQRFVVVQPIFQSKTLVQMSLFVAGLN